MVNLQEATEIIRDFLRNNITDPLNDRVGEWIYDDIPRSDLAKNHFPRIGVVAVRSDKNPAAIGTPKRHEIGSVDIIVKTAFSQKLTIGGTLYKDYEIVSYFGNIIDEAVKNNQSHWRDNDIIEVMPIYENPTRDERRNPTYQIGLRLKYIK